MSEFHRLVSQLPDSREALIELMFPDVTAIARSVCGVNHNRDDAVGEGLLALVQAVNTLKPEHPNPGGFIRTHVFGAVKRYLSNMNKGKFYPLIAEPAFVEQSEIFADELHDLITVTAIESQYLTLARKGYGGAEIAQKLHCRERDVTRLRESIQHRYNEVVTHGQLG